MGSLNIRQTKNGKTLKVAFFIKNASAGFCLWHPTPHQPKTSRLHSLILLNSPGRVQKRHAALGILATSLFLPCQVTSSYCCKHWEVQTWQLFLSSCCCLRNLCLETIRDTSCWKWGMECSAKKNNIVQIPCKTEQHKNHTKIPTCDHVCTSTFQQWYPKADLPFQQSV